MTESNDKQILEIDEVYNTALSENEAESLKQLQTEFIHSFLNNKDNMPVQEWLSKELKTHLPEKTEEEIADINSDIIKTLTQNEDNLASLNGAIENGRSKESWFASEAKRATSYMSAQEASRYLNRLDVAIDNANRTLFDTIHTQVGNINLNPQLDGFIAEQYHAQTFNLNAEATGSPYRAKVLQPEGTGYGRNSVDIVIVDDSGKIVRRYQSKYCKDINSTIDAFNKGDYRGQRKLVPDGQEAGFKNASNVIEAPDGTRSNPLSKQSAKDMQREAQSGNWNDLNWNEYKAKDLAIGIGKQAGQAALMGAAIGVGFNIAQKVCKGEKIEGEELVKTALISGADFGIKAAAAGALKVGVEKGVITLIPKGTPAGVIANIAFIGIENAKVLGKVATGELSLKDGLNKMEVVTVSTVAGIAASAEGMAYGAAIGTVLGPVGTVVGGFIGGTVGYMAGSKAGELVVRGVQKIREKTFEVIKSIGSSISSGIKNVSNGINNFGSGLKRLFS